MKKLRLIWQLPVFIVVVFMGAFVYFLFGAWSYVDVLNENKNE